MISRDIIRGAIEDALLAVARRHGGDDAGAGPASLLTRLLAGGDLVVAQEFLDVAVERLVREVSMARVVVTGPEWIGFGFGSVETALLDLVSSAQHEIAATIYSLGAETRPIIGAIEDKLTGGVRVALVVNAMDSQHPAIGDRLRDLAARFKHCTVCDFAGAGSDAVMHAKVVVADRRRALIGSANLSRGGLVSNHEMAVVVEGPAAEAAADRIDQLVLRLAR